MFVEGGRGSKSGSPAGHFISDSYKFPKKGSCHLKHHIEDYGINESLKSKNNMASMQ